MTLKRSGERAHPDFVSDLNRKTSFSSLTVMSSIRGFCRNHRVEEVPLYF